MTDGEVSSQEAGGWEVGTWERGRGLLRRHRINKTEERRREKQPVSALIWEPETGESKARKRKDETKCPPLFQPVFWLCERDFVNVTLWTWLCERDSVCAYRSNDRVPEAPAPLPLPPSLGWNKLCAFSCGRRNSFTLKRYKKSYKS